MCVIALLKNIKLILQIRNITISHKHCLPINCKDMYE
jgi:hypothetical protein